MAVALVQTVKKATTLTDPITQSVTLTAGNLLIVVSCLVDTGSGNPTVTGITWNSTSLTQHITRQTSTTDSRIYIHSLANVAGGTADVSVDINSAGPKATIYIVEVSGAATSSVADGAGASATGLSGSPASGNFTATNTDDFWIAGFVREDATVGATVTQDTAGGWSADTTNGRHTDGSTGSISAIEYRANPGSAGAFNGTFTSNSDDWSAVIFAFKAAAGGGGGRTTRNTRAFPLGMAIGMNWVGPGDCS